MKKALIAASIAAGLAGVANAANTTTLYGAIAYEVQYQHNGTTYSSTSNNYKNQWDLNTDAIRLGVKGEEDLNNGLTAFYNLLLNIHQAEGENTRYAYVGLKGDFGTLTLGKQDSLYKVMTNGNDIFEDAFFDDSMTYESLTGGSRPSKVISYVSPSMGGFTVGAAGVLDGAHEASYEAAKFGTSNNFNAAQFGAKYEYNGLTVSGAYSWASVDRNAALALGIDATAANVLGGQINYANDQFYIGAGAEHAFKIGNKYNIAGQYFYGPNTFQAGIGLSNSDDINAGDKVYTYALGYMYNFSKDTFTFVNAEYQRASGNNNFFTNKAPDVSNDGNTSEDYAGNNGYLVRVGLRHNF